MKVKPNSQVEPNSAGGTSRPVSNNPVGVNFLEQLHSSETEQKRLVCKEILGQIDDLSEKLKKKVTPEGLKRYKELVSSFLKEALGQIYTVDQQTRWGNSGNRKSMVLVKKVNDSLEELVELALSGKQLELVAKLDQIRGMLLDVYL